MEAKQPVERPYAVSIETATGIAIDVRIASLTPQELAKLLQQDFQRLAEEAGIRGARVHVKQAETADYDAVLEEVAAGLRRAGMKAA